MTSMLTENNAGIRPHMTGYKDAVYCTVAPKILCVLFCHRMASMEMPRASSHGKVGESLMSIQVHHLLKTQLMLHIISVSTTCDCLEEKYLRRAAMQV